jgi:DNA-binding NarL/FixJ family response regulator
VAGRLEQGRSAFATGAWGEAFAHLAAEDQLAQDDLERLAVAAHLVGEVRASELAWERAHRVAASRGDAERAARCAFWLGFDLFLRGEGARASGWLARAERAMGDERGSAAGLLLLPPFLSTVQADAAAALEMARQMTTIARDTGDRDLLAFGLLCQGEALIALGEPVEGTRCLDEVMVSITTGEVSPIPTGVIYCAVIDACMHLRDLRRAAEWTSALSAWCGTDPSLVPYRGQCLVHRSQVLTARGAWREATEEAERARAHLAEPAHPALGDALYQQGELHRLRGELAEAEAAYGAASRCGRDPVPGFGLLRLAQGRADAAGASARRMLHESRLDPDRPALLAAAVEILVAVDALDEAATACDELEVRAAAGGTELVTALAATARGSMQLARGEHPDAAAHLRRSIALWRGLEMPFELARARAQMARVFDALGDRDGAELERQAARAAFEQLGARTELELLGAAVDHSPLTTREREVIRLVASGRTNREIASELVISEHTVARHLQNIFLKLDLSSRSAATAYAYEHGLV